MSNSVHVIVIDSAGAEHVIEAPEGAYLIDIVEEAGVSLLASCGRGQWCATCALHVLSGAENLTHLDEEEVLTLRGNGMEPADPFNPPPVVAIEDVPFCQSLHSRLTCACQIVSKSELPLILHESGDS